MRVIALLLGVLLLALGAQQAQAMPFTYQYQGNPFTSVTGSYTTSDAVSARFTFNLPTNRDLPKANYRAFVTSFSLSDGLQTLSGPAGLGDTFTAIFSTDGSGAFVEWDFGFSPAFSNSAIVTVNESGRSPFDAAQLGGQNASNLGTPGSWTQVKVAEPATAALLALSLLLLLGLAARQGRLGRSGRRPTFQGAPL